MSTDPQRLWYDLIRRLGRGPEPRTLGPEEAWAEYLAAPHRSAPPTRPGDASAKAPPATDDSGFLVERARRGSETAWREILRRYRPMLAEQVNACLSDAPRGGLEPEDLVQEVFLRVWKEIEAFEYRGEGSFRRWLAARTLAVIQARLRGTDPRQERARMLASLGSLEGDAHEKQALLNALNLTGGDKVAAARLLHMGKGAFYRKLESHGLAGGRNEP